jgi:tetratricopeptide (TPR) repeat protein
MHYKGARKSISQIAGDLNVDAVVEGTVLQSGNRVRISAQLIQVKNEKHLWAHSYESDLSDVLNLQQRAAQEIVEQIRPKLTPGEQARLTKVRSVDPQAHEAYLKGRYVLEQSTPEAAKHAIGLFKSAIQRDPQYAQAYSGLADSYSQLGGLLAEPDRTIGPNLNQAAQKAVTLDDSLAEAHASLGIEYQREWKWTDSERELQRAIQLNSNYALAHLDYGYLLILSGDTEQALFEFKRALELNPASPGANMGLGWGYFFAQRYDEAIQQANTTVDLNPALSDVHLLLGVSYSHKGEEQKGFAEWLKVMRMNGDSELADELQHVAATAPVARAKERMGRAIVNYLLKKSKRKYVSPLEIARAYSGNLGDYARAMVWLQKSYDEHVDTLPWIRVDPDFDGMRSNKRFRELQARMGLPIQLKAQPLNSQP